VPSIPLSGAARAAAAASPGAMLPILSGGDDYEILAAVPHTHADAFEASCKEAGVPVTRIGTISAGTGLPIFRNADGSQLQISAKGFEHFET